MGHRADARLLACALAVCPALDGCNGAEVPCEALGAGLAIVQGQIPNWSADDGNCLVPSERTARLNEGLLDVALDRPHPYWLYPLVENAECAAATPLGAKRVDVTGFEVTLEPPAGVELSAGHSCGNRFEQQVGQVALRPGDRAAFAVEIIRACHAFAIRWLFERGFLSIRFEERVVFRASVRARGHRASAPVVSGSFSFPVRVCYGCLQTGFTHPDFVPFDFPAVPPCHRIRGNPYPGNPCNVAQDVGPVLCCARDTQGRDLECPARPRPQRDAAVKSANEPMPDAGTHAPGG